MRFIMKKVAFFGAVFGLTLFSGLLPAQDYKVIVNSSNTVASMTKTEVSKIFLKKVISWNNGKKVNPVDLSSDSSIREAFSEEIHGKKVKAIRAYWGKMIFSGRAVPPPEKASDADVIAYVQENLDAVGYVSASAPTSDVKVLSITE